MVILEKILKEIVEELVARQLASSEVEALLIDRFRLEVL